MKRKKTVKKIRVSESGTAPPSDHKMAPDERVSSDCVCACPSVSACVVSHGTSLCVFMSLLSILSVWLRVRARAPQHLP